MGAGTSQLSPFSKIATGKELMAKTEDVRKMSEALFSFMYSRWDQREMWDIAKNPSDYVAALTEMIQDQFTVLGYRTKDGRAGEIYFKRYLDLKPPGEADKSAIADSDLTELEKQELLKTKTRGIEKQRKHAMIIAFYFVRLFQIMGSLLLVVKDISFPITDPKTGLIRDSSTPENMYGREYIGKFKQYGGGDIDKELALGPYEFLRFYLKKVTQSMVDMYKTKYKIDLKLKPTLFKISDTLFFEYVPPNPLPPSIIAKQTPYSKLITFTKQGSSNPTPVELEIKVINIVFTGDRLYQAPIQYEPNNDKRFNSYPASVTFNLVPIFDRSSKSTSRLEFSVTKDEKIVDKNLGPENGIKYKFSKGGEGLEDASDTTETQQFITKLTKATVQEYIKIMTAQGSQGIKAFSIKKDEDSSRPLTAKSLGKLPPKMSMTSIDEMYQVLRNKEKTEPKGESVNYESVLQPHCISRALQLLDASSIESYLPTQGTTKICKFSIGDIKTDTTLLEYKPIKSVAQLYGKVDPASFEKSIAVLSAFVGKYDDATYSDPTTVPLSVPELSSEKVNQKGEADSLARALQRLSTAFATTTDASGTIGSLSSIAAKKSPKCTGIDKEIALTQPVTLELQGYARQLLSYHVKQTMNIAKFLETIFDIRHESTGPKVYGPRLGFLTAGFDQLNLITDQARELLVDYYEGCESLYQKGVKSWEREQGDSAPGALPGVAAVNSEDSDVPDQATQNATMKARLARIQAAKPAAAAAAAAVPVNPIAARIAGVLNARKEKTEG